nr:unnamed protein product [Callosobruchus chinensis]
MPYREFKHIDELLSQKNNILIRYPSVSSKIKNSRRKVKQSKRIGCLEIHIESDIKTKGVRHSGTQCWYSFELNKILR